MIMLSWNYRKVNNPQKVICQNANEAKAIKRFVKRYTKELEPIFYDLEEGKEVAINGKN